MTHSFRDRLPLTRSSALAAAVLILASVTAAVPADAADPSPSATTVDRLVGPSAPAGLATHTDIVLSDVGPATAPAETRIDASVTRGDEAVTVGQVQFSINGQQVSDAVPVIGGMASLLMTQGAPGTYTVSARYVGYADETLNLDPSASGKATFEVVPPGTGCVGSTTCDQTPGRGDDDDDDDDDQSSGVIVITTPYTDASPLTMPPMTLQRAANCVADPFQYQSDAPFTGISVVDSREGRRPWTVSVISEDFVLDGLELPTAGDSQRIDAQNVGLTNLALTSTTARPEAIAPPRPSGAGNLPLPVNFTVFDNPAAPHLPGGAAGSLGLGGTPKRAIHANLGSGSSTFVGTLSITAPTTTAAGAYRGVVTFTVLGS